MASARLSYEQEPAGIGPFVGAASRTAVARATAAGPPWTNNGLCGMWTKDKARRSKGQLAVDSEENVVTSRRPPHGDPWPVIVAQARNAR